MSFLGNWLPNSFACSGNKKNRIVIWLNPLIIVERGTALQLRIAVELCNITTATVSVLDGLQKGGRHDMYSNDFVWVYAFDSYCLDAVYHVEKFARHKKTG